MLQRAWRWPFARGPAVGAEALLLFNHQWIALLRAGLTVPDALSLLGQRSEPVALASVVADVHAQVVRGCSLAEGCAAHPAVFDPLYLAAVQVGEQGGDLAAALARHQEHLARRVALGRRWRQALVYPAFLLVALVVILAALFLFVLPRFVALYADFGAPLPAPTLVLVTLVKHLPEGILIASAAAVAALLLLRRPGLRAKAEHGWSRLLDHLPVLGDAWRHARHARLSRSLASLLAAGMPVVPALAALAQAGGQAPLQRALNQVRRRVEQGDSLSDALRAHALLPTASLQMVSVGESAGSLPSLLAETARFHEERLDHALARATSLLEPVLMLLVGSLVGGIIVVMYLPIFGIAEAIR